jgi:hypothetical protein
MNKARVLISSFTLMGLICMGVGAGWLIHTIRFLDRAQHANGVVVENVERRVMETDNDNKQHEETYYYPRIRFKTARGQSVEILSSTGSNPPSYQPGAQVEVLYEPADPANASLRDWSLWFGPGMFLGLGGIAAAVGMGFGIAQIRKKKKESWLHGHGTQILADFSSVERGSTMEEGGPRPWYIVCQWLDPKANRIHVFKSDGLIFDPTSYIVTGRQIPVTIDPRDAKQYSVDLSFLPGVAQKERSGWKSVTGLPRKALDSLRNRWRSLTGGSLDALLMGFYHICMLGLLGLAGALNEPMQLVLTGVLVLGIVQLSLWQRRAMGWLWPGPTEDLVRSLLVLGGVSLLIFVGFAFIVPIRNPAYLPWDLAGGGLVVFNVLRLSGVVVRTREEFRRSCRVEAASAPLSGRAGWKRLARFCYEVFFVAVWLATIAYFFLWGLAARGVAGLPGSVEKLPAMSKPLLDALLQPSFLNLLGTTVTIAFPSAIVAGCLLHFVLGVPLFPKRRPHLTGAEPVADSTVSPEERRAQKAPRGSQPTA